MGQWQLAVHLKRERIFLLIVSNELFPGAWRRVTRCLGIKPAPWATRGVSPATQTDRGSSLPFDFRYYFHRIFDQVEMGPGQNLINKCAAPWLSETINVI